VSTLGNRCADSVFAGIVERIDDPFGERTKKLGDAERVQAAPCR
jgi:hypothetical protein